MRVDELVIRVRIETVEIALNPNRKWWHFWRPKKIERLMTLQEAADVAR